MKEETRHAFIWGWLRMALGIGQMSVALVSVITLIAVGFQPITYALVALATALTLLSRILYKGRKDPRLKGTSQIENHPPPRENS
jgi:hypothetical protein